MDTLLSTESLRQNFKYWCKIKEIGCAESNRFEYELCFLHKAIAQDDHYGLDEADVVEATRLVKLYGKPLAYNLK